MRIASTPALLAVILALTGCGRADPDPASRSPAQVEERAGAPADQDEPSSGTKDDVTAIDAALGRARAMPADHAGPTAFDLAAAARSEVTKSEPRPKVATGPRSAAARLDGDGASIDLIGADDSVTIGG